MKTPFTLKSLVACAALQACCGAQASIVYQMVGGTCTDSNANQVFFPDPAGLTPPRPGVSPPLCTLGSAMSVTLSFRDTYVPGADFYQDASTANAARLVERMTFFDGFARVVDFDFLGPVGGNGRIFGGMPATSGAGNFTFLFNPFGGGVISVEKNGTWSYSNEDSGVSTGCGIASMVGVGAVCVAPRGYNSVGTYGSWQRVGVGAVPEPGALALVAFGLAAAGLARRRPV